MTPGRLITIEGLDGAGKTTLAAALSEELRTPQRRVELLREPGGVPAAECIRELVKAPELAIGARAEALLYAAARAQLVEEAIAPLLAAGTWVILDRFVDSSLAYQGGGRELGIDEVAAINQFATGGVIPDRTLLLMIDRAAGVRRMQGRGEPLDRLELEGDDFRARIERAYRQLEANDRRRIRLLDASRPPEQVLADALSALADLR